MGMGSRLEMLRKQKGMTQTDLAKKLHTTQSAIGHWENERRSVPQDKIIDIANLFGVSTDYLYGIEPSNEKSEKIDLKEMIKNNTMTYNGNELTEHDLNVIDTFLSALLNKEN